MVRPAHDDAANRDHEVAGAVTVVRRAGLGWHRTSKGTKDVNSTVDAANLVAQGTDFSLWGLFLEANFVVKLVMLGLLVASVWVWAVVFEKVVSLRKVNREATAFEDRFWSGGSLDELFDQEGDNPKHPMAVGVLGRDERVAAVEARRRRRYRPFLGA